MIPLFIALALLAGAPAAAQQHSGHSHAPTAAAPASDASPIKALSAQEQQAWREGQGAGLAKAAELNGHPGPMHVLEHAGELGLTPSQQDETRARMQAHKAEVRALGAQLLDAERRLDELFRTRRATASQVSELTQTIGALQARIRASHLIAHLVQTALLRPDQIATYDRLRGNTR